MILFVLVGFTNSGSRKRGARFDTLDRTSSPGATPPIASPAWPDPAPKRYSPARRVAIFMVGAFATGTLILWLAQQPSRRPTMETCDEIALISPDDPHLRETFEEPDSSP
jgi:hypothetical protein